MTPLIEIAIPIPSIIDEYWPNSTTDPIVTIPVEIKLDFNNIPERIDISKCIAIIPVSGA